MIKAIGCVVQVCERNIVRYYVGRKISNEKLGNGQYKQVRYNDLDVFLDKAHVFIHPGTAVRKARECNGVARIVAVDTDTHKKVLMEGEVTPICEKKGAE